MKVPISAATMVLMYRANVWACTWTMQKNWWKKGEAYYCFCTKERLESLKESNAEGAAFAKYDRHCLGLSKEEVQAKLDAGVPFVIRQKMPDSGTTTFSDVVYGDITVENTELDDQILMKADGFPTYNFANVVDDHLMHITHVVRGSEYLSSTPKYNLLYKAFGWEPPVYVHLPAVMRDAHHKLSKRHGAVSVMQYRDDGYLPEALLNYLVRLGWSHGDQEIFTREEMIKYFTLNAVSKSASAFNTDKLLWLNHHYINALPPEYVATHLQWHIEQENIDTRNGPQLADLVKLLGERCKTLKEMAQSCRYFYEDFAEFDADAAKKHLRPVARQPLEVVRDKLAAITDWTAENVHHAIQATADELEVGMGKVGMPLRVAVTGAGQSPALDVTVHAIGKTRSIERINKALDLLLKRENQQ